jgi:hypothetical protein
MILKQPGSQSRVSVTSAPILRKMPPQFAQLTAARGGVNNLFGVDGQAADAAPVSCLLRRGADNGRWASSSSSVSIASSELLDDSVDLLGHA